MNCNHLRFEGDEGLTPCRARVYTRCMRIEYEIRPSFDSRFDVVYTVQGTTVHRIVGTYDYEVACKVADALNNEVYMTSKS